MITNSQMLQFSTPYQFIDYARAYLVAALDSCGRMVAIESQRTWPHGSVAYLLAAHSVELFLKGLILHREPAFRPNSHDIDKLIEKFTSLYPEKDFQVDFPFKTIFLGPLEPAEQPQTGKLTPLSVLYRYPVNQEKTPWSEVCGIEPIKFMEFLEKWQGESERMVEAAGRII